MKFDQKTAVSGGISGGEALVSAIATNVITKNAPESMKKFIKPGLAFLALGAMVMSANTHVRSMATGSLVVAGAGAISELTAPTPEDGTVDGILGNAKAMIHDAVTLGDVTEEFDVDKFAAQQLAQYQNYEPTPQMNEYALQGMDEYSLA